MAGLDLSKTATKLIQKLCASDSTGIFQLRRTTGAAIDPVTGKTTGGTTENIGINCGRVGNAEGLIPESRIIADANVYVMDNKVQPLMTDKLIDNGEALTIVGIETKRHASIVQVYFVQAKI